MQYLEFINKLIKNKVHEKNKLVLFGQNINAGSCLGGLTRGLKLKSDSVIIDSTNSENTLCGFGFGMMINGISSIFFMKQTDFLLLGIDHLVNTFNVIRGINSYPKTSFTIFPITVDNGFQGPQSSLNNFGDFCSIARIEGYTITNRLDAEKIIDSKLIEPGFRIITISQRMFKEDIIEPEKIISHNKDLSLFQYSDGDKITIVCFNFTFVHGWKLKELFKKNGYDISLFNVNSPTNNDWNKILENLKISKKLIVLDDSKSKNLSCDNMLQEILGKCKIEKKIIIKKKILDDWTYPILDELEINYDNIINEMINSTK